MKITALSMEGISFSKYSLDKEALVPMNVQE